MQREYNMCNHCNYNAMEQTAKKQGKIVVKLPSGLMGSMGGWEVHVLKRGEKATKANWKAWMMEVTDYCVC